MGTYKYNDDYIGLTNPIYKLSKEEQQSAIESKIVHFVANSEIHINNYDNTDGESKVARAARARDLYQNVKPKIDYDYLYKKVKKNFTDEYGNTQTFTLAPPAKVRNTPIVHPKLRALISNEFKRPLRTRVYAIDNKALERRHNAHVQALRQAEYKKVAAKLYALKVQQQAMAQQQQIYAQLQENPELQQYLPQIETALEMAQMEFERESILLEEEKEKINNFFAYSYRDSLAESVEKMLKSYHKKHGIRTLYNDGFEESVITDEEMYLVWWEPGMTAIKTELLRTENCYYPASDSTRFIREAPWFVRYTPMTYGELVANFGHELKEEELERIRKMYPYASKEYTNSVMGHDFIMPDGRIAGDHNKDVIDRDYYSIPVYHVLFKEQMNIYYKEWVDDDGVERIDYVDEDYEPKEGEKKVKRTRQDLYSGRYVGYYNSNDGCVFGVKKSAWQPRPHHSNSQVYLPIAGRAVNRFHQPRSYMMELEHVQDLYNILFYHQEHLVALAGVKGILYNLSQMPEGMEIDEVMYYMRQGVMFIETLDEQGNNKDGAFNQYATFDQTLSTSVGLIENIKRSLVDVVSSVTGVTPQMQGQVSQADQVGTYQMGLAMSNANVEVKYQRHEQVVEQANEFQANVIPLAHQKGAQDLYVDGARSEVVKFPKGQNGKFATYVGNGAKESMDLEKAQTAIEVALSAGAISISQYLATQEYDSIRDIKNALKDFEEKANQLASERSELEKKSQQEQVAYIENMKAELQLKLEQTTKNIEQQGKLQLEQLKIQAEQLKNNVQREVKKEELASKEKIAKMEDETKRFDIEAENTMESAYLNFQYAQLETNKNLQKQQQQLDRIAKRISSRSKENIKD